MLYLLFDDKKTSSSGQNKWESKPPSFHISHFSWNYQSQCSRTSQPDEHRRHCLKRSVKLRLTLKWWPTACRFIYFSRDKAGTSSSRRWITVSGVHLCVLSCQDGYRAFTGKIALRVQFFFLKTPLEEELMKGIFLPADSIGFFRHRVKRMRAITAVAPQERKESSSVPDMCRLCTVPWHVCCDDVWFFCKYELIEWKCAAKVWGSRLLV